MVAYLPGQSTMEISLTSGQFNSDLFVMANGSTDAEGTYESGETYNVYVSETLKVVENKITLTKQPVADNGVYAYVSGYGTITTAPAEKQITLTFEGTTAPAEVEVSYLTEVTADVIHVDNQTAAVGEAVLKWPVYDDGTDCTKSAIKGYVVMKIFRCRVTQMPKHNWALCA